MHLSMILDPGRTWPQMAELARRVDECGWHAVYTCDHFMPYDEGGRPLDGPVLECWTSLTALAGETTQVRLGPLVTSITYRHPAVVAKMAATLDVISAGRVILGVGAGWQVNEHLAYGLPLPPAPERLAALDEACTVITSLLHAQRTTFDGTSYRLVDAPADPKPVQGRLPLLVGASGERFALRVAARHADIWHAWTDADSLRRKSAVLEGYCEEAGRDPSAILRSSGGLIDLDEPLDSVAERMLALRDAGASEFVVIDDAENEPISAALERVVALTERVLPLVA